MPRASVVRGAMLGAALIVTMGGFFMPADVAATTADPAVFVPLRGVGPGLASQRAAALGRSGGRTARPSRSPMDRDASGFRCNV